MADQGEPRTAHRPASRSGPQQAGGAGRSARPADVLDLAPLRALRYADPRALADAPPLDIALALAPPYDVLGADAFSALIAAEPRNAARLTAPPAARDAPGCPESLAGPGRYRTAARTLRRWIDDGLLVRDPEPAIYVYEQTLADGARQRGLIGALALPPANGTAVRPHEDVAASTVADRAALMAASRANLEPIFLLYRGGTGASRGAASRTVDTVASEDRGLLIDTRTADGTTHRLWAVTDSGTHAAIAADLATRSALIADGHHRYAAYERLRAGQSGPGYWDRGLALLVDSDASPPHLGAIHRVLPGVDACGAVDAVAGFATVAELAGGPHEPGSATRAAARLAEVAEHGPALLLGGAGHWWLLHAFDTRRLAAALPDRSAQWRALPTAVLGGVLLPLWDVAEDAVRLVHDAPEEAAAQAGPDDSVVVLPPIRVEDVYAVTARGELTPRKSTSFGPKPRTGLVLRAEP